MPVGILVLEFDLRGVFREKEIISIRFAELREWRKELKDNGF